MAELALSDAYNIIRELLARERMTGFTNRATQGSVESFTSQWALGFSKRFPEYSSNMNAIWHALNGYSDGDLYARAKMIDRAIALIDELTITPSRVADDYYGLTSDDFGPPPARQIPAPTPKPSPYVPPKPTFHELPAEDTRALQIATEPKKQVNSGNSMVRGLGGFLFWGSAILLLIMELSFYYAMWGTTGLIIALVVVPAITLFPIVYLAVGGFDSTFLLIAVLWFLGLVGGVLLNRSKSS